MDFLTEFFTGYGYLGMGLLAFISGSVLPMTSEALLIYFLTIGLNRVGLVAVSTIGNALGGLSCFYMGRMAKQNWFASLFSVSPKRMEQAAVLVRKYGVWASFFSFVPLVGTAIIVLLGIMRVKWWKVAIVMTLGKLVRYIVVVLSYDGVLGLIGLSIG